MNPTPRPATLAQLVADARRRLAGNSAIARLDSEVLLAKSLAKPRSYLLAWPEHRPTAAEVERFLALIERRREGCPVAYLLGEQEFWSLPLRVSPATLIPRPETELVVEQALRITAGWRNGVIVDLGTGSGAIAIAVARERPGLRIVATDHSSAALSIARGNARRHGAGKVEFVVGNWLAPLRKGPWIDMLLSNPPYVACGDPHLLQGDLRSEPPQALVSGADGLDAIRQILAAAPARLVPGGHLLLEHGYQQGAAVAELMRDNGFEDIRLYQDLAGNDRVTAATISRGCQETSQ